MRAARDSTAWFPDGQLYVELCRPDGAPRDPAEVLVRLFRTRTSGARLLLVLDGAVDDRQVAPLLPGAPEAAVLVTGQTRLAGADTVTLSLLDATEARELLGSLVGWGAGSPSAGAGPAAWWATGSSADRRVLGGGCQRRAGTTSEP
ncbi:hypothetical protein [Streptomyces sp. NPDC058583]|uniref:hypothetical protein n=1 Tax=unclassified Streptomyces TaxID=2593676 RepID=UPI003664B9E9